MATDPLRLVARAAAVVAGAALVAVPAAAPAPTTTAHARQLAVPVLMYHRIDYLRPGLPEITRRLTVDPSDFARQMTWLSEHGFHTLTRRQLRDAFIEGRSLPEKPIVITFDDGYRDVLGKASPVLLRLRMHAIEYVITARLDGRDPSFLTAPQLRLLERRGIEIGSHTVTHADLPTLSDSDALGQLVKSRQTLERVVGHRVPWFAYPYGHYDERVARLVQRAGYELAVTTMPGSCQDSGRRFELQRLEVVDTTGVRGLAAMLQHGC